MSPAPQKLQKIRTFRGDIDAAKGTAPVPPPEETEIVSKPKVTFTPVLNERKDPIVETPIVVTPPPAPIPTPPPPVLDRPIGKSLQADITASLGDSRKPPVKAPAIPSTISTGLVRDTERVAAVASDRLEMMDRGEADLGGTVITNQKRDRFKLLPSMWSAVKLWFQETENALARRAEKKRLAIPTVRTVEERKDVIKKAASVGAIAPKDDHAKLANKLPPRTTETPIKHESTVIIADKAAVPTPGWSHFENQSAPAVPEAKQITPPVIEPVKPVPPPPIVPVKETPPEPIKPAPLPPPAPVPPPVVEPIKPIPPPIVPVKETPPPIVPVKETPPEPVAPIRVAAPTPPEPLVVREMVPPPVKAAPITAPPVAVARPAIARTKRNFTGLFYVGVAATAVIAVIGGGALVNSLLGDSEPTNVTLTTLPTETVTTTPIREDSMVKTILPRTRQEWYENVSASGRGGILTILPVVNIGGAEKNAAAAEVLTTLSWKVEPALTRSIADITFIMAEQKPAIVLKVTTFDAAFGGLLLSEEQLSEELSPLFGPIVTSTYKVGVGTVAPTFVDELAANHDVRVLKDEMENERLVYGFIDQNTVVIAPDKEAFLLIVERLR